MVLETYIKFNTSVPIPPSSEAVIHLKVNCLKVNSKAINIARLLELARYPLIISGIKQLIKYWIKIKNMNENTL